MCFKNCSEAQRVESLLFSNLTPQPNDTVCTSFLNIVKATNGTVKISMVPGEKMSVWKV